MPQQTIHQLHVEHAFDQAEVPFGSNDVRLSLGRWAIAFLITLTILYAAPAIWQRIESFEPEPDYRVPYRLGNDYWQTARYFRNVCQQHKILLLGDSVVWGHYVDANETLSHYLNAGSSEERFANLGVDGIHPAALAGLIEHYGDAITGRDVILHCNLLWTSSKRHDLQVEKEFVFNHPALVPQFVPRIPCYKEPLSSRLGIVIERQWSLFGWAKHLQIAYFEGADLPRWTIEHPYEGPVASLTLELPSPDEPPSPPPVARPWTETGIGRFDAQWVDLASSFQWRSFQRVVEVLRQRKNRVFVLVGPFNEHMLTQDSLATYKQRQHQVEAWLQEADDSLRHPFSSAQRNLRRRQPPAEPRLRLARATTAR